MKPYIDKSTNEKGEQEISIHGLSPIQFALIQMFVRLGAKACYRWRQIFSSDPIVPDANIVLNTIKEFNPNA